ncbi:hypothetical protein Aperf_G00000125145 [Anoplocephala perfoliata]
MANAPPQFYQPQALPHSSQQMLNSSGPQLFEPDENSRVSLQETWDTNKVYTNLQSNREMHGAGVGFGRVPLNYSPAFSGNTSQGTATCSTEGTPAEFHRQEQYTPPGPSEGPSGIYYGRSPPMNQLNGVFNDLNGNAMPMGNQAVENYANRMPHSEEGFHPVLAQNNGENIMGFPGRSDGFQNPYYLSQGHPGGFPRPDLVGSAPFQHPAESMMPTGREMFQQQMDARQMQGQPYHLDLQQRVPPMHYLQAQPGFQPTMPPPANPPNFYPQQIPNNNVSFTATPYNEMAAQSQSLPPQPAAQQIEGPRRKNASRKATAILKQWLNDNTNNPYPSKSEKAMLANSTSMSSSQISTWFANARRRLKKENKMTWAPRTGSTDTRPRVPEIVAGEDSSRHREDAAARLEGVPQPNPIMEERIVQHHPFEFTNYPPPPPPLPQQQQHQQQQEVFVQRHQPPAQVNPQAYLGNPEESRLFYGKAGDVYLRKDTVDSNSN